MRTLKQHIKHISPDNIKTLKGYCLASGELYNDTLRTIKQYYTETNKYIPYNSFYHIVKNFDSYKKLPRKISVQIMRLVDQDIRGFFSLLKRKQKGQYADQVNFPKFKNARHPFILILPKQQIAIKKGILKITKTFKLPFTFKIPGEIKQIIIIPKKNGYYVMDINYEEYPTTKPELIDQHFLSIDLGIDNFATIFGNNSPNFIISGKPLKSYNQSFNKKKSRIKSELWAKNHKFYSEKLRKMDINRYNFINNYINQSVHTIVKYCLKYKIQNVIMGYNELWKKDVSLGTKTNQKFHFIPFLSFKQKLNNKCMEQGISFLITEESYTSKCSALDKESIEKHEIYKGKRMKRGLFQTSEGKTLNADINGAINIMRKVIGDNLTFKFKSIERCMIHPIMLTFKKLTGEIVNI